MRTVADGDFRENCLALMEEVHATGQPVLITQRGKALARLIPASDSPQVTFAGHPDFSRLKGLITVTHPEDDFTSPIIPADEWDLFQQDCASTER